MEILLSKRIREYRKKRGFTQEQLAEAMGVTVGAVSKWESGASTPDLNLIVELADFFETSVDVLLGYVLEKSSCEKAVEKIKGFLNQKNYKEGCMECDKDLQRYPNSFEVVYYSAKLFYLKGIELKKQEDLNHALGLYQRACTLLDQNTDEEINEVEIQNNIGVIYVLLGDMEQGIEHLKKYNYGGVNNSSIGLFLIKDKQYEKALPYLSHQLIDCIASLIRTTVGYINYFGYKKDPKQALGISQWMHDLLCGLELPGQVSYVDKLKVMMLTASALVYAEEKEFDHAKEYLRKARSLAKRFDAAPDFGQSGFRYYYGENHPLGDDFGTTAVDGILENIRENEETRDQMLKLWEELENEDKSEEIHETVSKTQ